MNSAVMNEHIDPRPVAATEPTCWRLWGYAALGALALFATLTWLVWFSAYIQRQLVETDVAPRVIG